MVMTFYYLSGSPFSGNVWLALEHKKIECSLTVMSVDAGDLEKPEFLVINPRGKVPAIVHDDFALYESAAIVEYLEDQFPDKGESLWPRDKKLRASGRRIVSEVQSYLYPPVRRMVEELLLRRDGSPDMQAATDARSLIPENLRMLMPSDHADFLLGKSVSAADYSLYPLTAIIHRLHSGFSDLGIKSVLPEPLNLWRTRIEALPYFEKTLPPHWRQ